MGPASQELGWVGSQGPMSQEASWPEGGDTRGTSVVLFESGCGQGSAMSPELALVPGTLSRSPSREPDGALSTGKNQGLSCSHEVLAKGVLASTSPFFPPPSLAEWL